MSEKRFTFANGFKIIAIKDNGQIMNSREVCGLLNTLSNENEQLKRENELLSDELEQCKAVIDNKWKEYLDKKGDVE